MANNKAKKFAGVKPKNPIFKKVAAPSKQVKKHLAQKTKQKNAKTVAKLDAAWKSMKKQAAAKPKPAAK